MLSLVTPLHPIVAVPGTIDSTDIGMLVVVVIVVRFRQCLNVWLDWRLIAVSGWHENPANGKHHTQFVGAFPKQSFHFLRSPFVLFRSEYNVAAVLVRPPPKYAGPHRFVLVCHKA